ncbi:MAG TPA: hypothetical protein VNZ64_19605 [Candidatus Acidoferrum sp.]|jgi:hypothetical protein|nr:hypothetical protein [Candidatus Acidoferrum sp.]
MGLFTVWWERYHSGTQGGVFALGLRARVLIASHAVWVYAGKPAEAREEFSEVLRLKPGDAEAQRELQKPGGVQILRQ